MKPSTDPDGEFTELTDARIPRVDLVDKAANGMTFLIAKNASDGGGLIDPALVRELIGKSEPEPETRPEPQDTVTMTGSPGAIFKLIHEAAVAKATGPAIPDDTNEVAKDMDPDDSTDRMDPTVALAEPENDLPGSDTDPGSPAWEAIDAATACKWTAILARAKGAIDILAEREMLEAASADPEDAENAWDLQDACCAIDYAISVLAPFAVSEKAEAECAADQMSMVGKALGDFDPASLDTIEVLSQVRKSGRVLSAANEAAIRGAAESLQKVLASLPQAPEVPEESGRPVAKQEETMAEPTETAPVEPVEKIAGLDAPDAPVEKADKVPQVAVYDAKGNLVGIADPADITPISGAETDGGGEEVVPDTDGDATPDGAQTAAPDPADLTPAPAAEAGTPADAVPDDVTKTTVPDPTPTTSDTDTDSDAVLKSIVTDAVTAALADYSATHKEDVAKQATVLDELTETVETLKGQIEAYGEQPAPPKVFTNGAVPPAAMLRGQDRGAPPVDVAKAAEMRQSLYKSHDAIEQNRIAEEMKAGAIDALQAIHHGGATQ